jgi:hypothetical protein
MKNRTENQISRRQKSTDKTTINRIDDKKRGGNTNHRDVPPKIEKKYGKLTIKISIRKGNQSHQTTILKKKPLNLPNLIQRKDYSDGEASLLRRKEVKTDNGEIVVVEIVEITTTKMMNDVINAIRWLTINRS